MKNLLVILCLILSACATSKPDVSTEAKTETKACQTSGVCDYSEYNSTTKRFENFHGGASACPGTMTREVRVIRKSDGTKEELFGAWSACKLK